MRLDHRILVTLALAASVLTVAVPAARMAEATEKRAAAIASLDRIRTQAGRVLELRSVRQRAAEQKRPEQDLIARVGAVAAAIGLDQDHFAGVRPRNDVALAGNRDDAVEYRRQVVQLTFRRLELRKLGALLHEWASSQPLWTPTQIDLTHTRGKNSPARYDVTILVSATYVADR